MASLRTSAAARLLRGTSQCRAVGRRFESELATTDEKAVAPARLPNQPDYGALIDRATSCALLPALFVRRC